MRVLLVSPLYPPQVGGAAGYVRTLVEQMPGLERVELIRVLAPLSIGSTLVQRHGARVMVLSALFPAGASKYGLRSIGFAWNQAVFFLLIPFFSRIWRIDVVVFHSRFSMIKGRRQHRVLSYVLPLICQGIFVWDIRCPGEVPRHAGRFAAVLCASQSVFQKARQWWPEDRCFLTGVPFTLAPVSSDGGDGVRRFRPYACYVGDVHAGKGIPELVAAWGRTRRQDKLRLVLVGPNRMGTQLNNLLADRPDIEYLGPLPHEQALAVLDNAELLVYPSHSEGLPRTCLEGLALGKRVVLPPGVPEFQEHCAEFVLDRVTPDAIAETVERVLASPKVPHYPLEQHDSARVVGRFVESLAQILARANNHST